jgi:hypothetical protein
MGVTVNNELGEGSRKVIGKSQVMIMIGGDVKSICFVTSIRLNPSHDLLDSLVNVEHGSKHVVQVVGMSSPIDLNKMKAAEKGQTAEIRCFMGPNREENRRVYNTYISLFVHHKEAIVILGQEFESSHHVLCSGRNLCDLFRRVVIA